MDDAGLKARIRRERHWDFYFIAYRAVERAQEARQAYLLAEEELVKSDADEIDADPVFRHLIDAIHALVSAQIMAGVASEAYITQYIFDRFKGQDLKLLEKMPTMAKWRFAPALAMKIDGFQFGEQVLNGLEEVRKVRDELVHFKPQLQDVPTTDQFDEEVKKTKRLVNHVVHAIKELHKIDPAFGKHFVEQFLKPVK